MFMNRVKHPPINLLRNVHTWSASCSEVGHLVHNQHGTTPLISIFDPLCSMSYLENSSWEQPCRFRVHERPRRWARFRWPSPRYCPKVPRPLKGSDNRRESVASTREWEPEGMWDGSLGCSDTWDQARIHYWGLDMEGRIVDLQQEIRTGRSRLDSSDLQKKFSCWSSTASTGRRARFSPGLIWRTSWREKEKASHNFRGGLETQPFTSLSRNLCARFRSFWGNILYYLIGWNAIFSKSFSVL